MQPRFWLVALSLLGVTASGAAQTTINPDISLVGDLRAFSHDDQARAAEAETFNLADPEMELYVTGYLNPYARATATVAWHPGANAEMEEVYAEFLRGLPLGAHVRAGKYLLPFGRLNPVHPHAYSFIKRTLPHEILFSEEGMNDVAAQLSFLLPTGNAYTEAFGAVLKGDAFMGHGHGTEHGDIEAAARRDGAEPLALGTQQHEHEESGQRTDPGFFGRLSTSMAVGVSSELALGGSVVNSVYRIESHEHELLTEAQQEAEDPEQWRSWLVGADVKYRYRPDRYTALQIEAEGIWRSDDHHEADDLTSYGGYGYVDYRFRQRYNAGGIVEFVRTEHAHEVLGETEIEQIDIWRAGLFVGFAPVEETSLIRLAGHWTEPDQNESFWEVNLQLVFSLGPHQPHNF